MSGFTFPSSSSSSSSSLFATSSSPSSSLSLSNPTSSPTISFGFQPSSKSSPFGGAAGGFAANSSSAPASIPSSSAPSFRSRPAFSTNLFSSSSSAATTNTSTLSAPSLPSTPTITASSAPSFFLGTHLSFSNTTTTSTVSTPSFPSTPTITASSAPSFFTASSAPSFSLGTRLSFSNTTTTSTVSTPSFPSTPSITASNTTTTSTVSTTATATAPASNLTIVIEEFEGFSRNQVYEASQTYLSTKISPSVDRLRVSKAPRDKSFLVALEKGEMIAESFEGIQLEWRSVSSEIKRSNSADNQGYSTQQSERRAFELSFDKKYKEKVLGSYLPRVLEQANAIKEGDKVVKLYTLGPFYGDDGGGGSGGVWGSINLDHPSTFDTLAMDSELKVALKNDLDRFLQRKEFYKKVGKAWKRGYLLYGPPGTGKSSLIAAMANYLKFDVYDLELTGVYSDAELRRLLVATAKRSILVIEDIDCKAKPQPREYSKDFETSEKLTLSGLLNFIDGLWSSCGDERIIIFTTNHKDRLDPALLRPGRMDMHIHMSYCTPSGFKLLASNYLSIQDHKLFKEIETLIQTVDVTPAEITEELLKQDDAEAALEGLVQLLLQKRIEKDAVKDESEKEKEQDECQPDDDEQENENTVEKKEIEITRRQWPATEILNGEETSEGGRGNPPSHSGCVPSIFCMHPEGDGGLPLPPSLVSSPFSQTQPATSGMGRGRGGQRIIRTRTRMR